MGKAFKAQASSSRAVSGAFAPADGVPAHFGGGFGAVPASPLSYVYEPPDLSSISEPNVVVAFKNLQKKDSTTKAKALEDLQNFVSGLDPKDGVEEAVLEPWIKVYPRTSIDTARRVRQLAHMLQGAIARKSGKKFARCMPDVAGPWLAGTFDGDKMVSNAAKESLRHMFQSDEKLKNVWRAYLGSILQYCSGVILKETALTLSDERTVSPDDAFAKHARVVASAIHVVRHAMGKRINCFGGCNRATKLEVENTGRDALDRQQDILRDLLNQKELWKFSYHSDSAVRRAVYRLLDSSLTKAPETLDLELISSFLLLSSLPIGQESSAADYARVLAHLTEHDARVWTDYYKGTGKKSALKRLGQFLARGSQRGPSAYWDEVNTLLRHIPQSVLLPSEDIRDQKFVIFEVLRDGITNRDEARSNQSAAWNAYLSLVKRFLSSSDVDRDGLIGSTVMPMLVQYIIPSLETSSYTVSASQQPIILDATKTALSSHQCFVGQWQKVSKMLIEDIQTSLPQQSKDFVKSQDTIAAKASRWYSLQGALSNVEVPTEIKRAMTETTLSEIQSAIALLEDRNGKPYGAASLIECAFRAMPDLASTQDTLRTTIAGFLKTHLPQLIFSPSGPILVGLLPSLQDVLDIDRIYRSCLRSVLEAPDSPTKTTLLYSFVSSPCLARLDQDPGLLEKLISDLQQAVDNADEADEAEQILKTAIANPDAPPRMTHILLTRLIDNLAIEERRAASLKGLETVVAHNRDAIKAYDASTEGSPMLTKLMPLTAASDVDYTTFHRVKSLKDNIQALISTDPVQAYQTRLQIIRRNLHQVKEDALPMSSILNMVHETLDLYGDEQSMPSMAEELLPDEARWNEALLALYASKPNPSLAMMNDLGTAIILAEPTSSPRAVSFDKAGLSAAFRMFWFTYALISSSDLLKYATTERRSCTYRHLFIISAMASDKLSIDSAHSLWEEQGPEPDQGILSIIIETQKGLGSLLAETPVNAALPGLLSKLLDNSHGTSVEAYYNSRAYVSVAMEMVSRHTDLEHDVGIDELRSAQASANVFTGIATISAIQNPTALTKIFNELLATLTGLDLTKHVNGLPHLVMLNSILNNQDFGDVLTGIPKQRLIFFIQHACTQLSEYRSSKSAAPSLVLELGLNAEIMRALNQILPVLKETYGSFWEDVINILTQTWSPEAAMSDGKLPLIHASLRLYSTLLRLASGEANDDLVDASKAHEGSIADGMVNLLQALQSLPDDSHAPRKMVNELLARLISKTKTTISRTRISELFPILASESIALQGAAHEILHSQIPQEQENVSVDKALSKESLAKLPEELLSLVIEAPTRNSLADVSFTRSVPPFLQSYMLSWHLIFDHWDGASDAVKNDYISSLKEGPYLNDFLQFASDFLITSRVRPIDASKFEVDTYRAGEESPDRDAQWLLIHLYYLALKNLPTLSKTWWRDNTSRQTQTSVESWTEKYIAPHIIASELSAVSSWATSREADTDQPLTVKISTSTREITASIPIDEQSMSIAITLPPSYPLSRATVSGLHRVGVTEQKWRSWVITTQGVINFSDIGGGGQLIDGLMAWRKNVTATLKGQTECAICYSVVSADRQLPSKRCGTCKNSFHGSCLFKWFKSSNSSSCPLCRNQFSYS
ncbi:MAG: hypothetical protein Q9208_002959 [Pyrenodesmia sp. 3 TL-2023]